MLDKIKSLCKKNGINLSQLEIYTGIGKNTIWRWDKVCPSANNLKKVADYFSVTVDDLLRGDMVEENARNDAPDELSKHIDN